MRQQRDNDAAKQIFEIYMILDCPLYHPLKRIHVKIFTYFTCHEYLQKLFHLHAKIRAITIHVKRSRKTDGSRITLDSNLHSRITFE